MTRLLVLFLSLFWMSSISAETLRSASRWDISMKPYKFELQGELVRAVDDYRTAVNQIGIEPSRDRQVRAEIDRLEQLLKSRGYYLSTVIAAFDADQNKPKYQIVLGPRFTVAQVEIRGNYQPQDNDWQQLKAGDALSAVQVINQQNALRSYIAERNCYFNLRVDHEVELDENSQSANVTYVTLVSSPAVFGSVQFDGAEGISESFLARVTDLRQGRCFKRRDLDTAVISLFDTGLFKQVRPSFELNENDRVDVVFSVSKREKRNISASVGWKSEQGIGVRGGWLHRDLFGRAQSLQLLAEVQADEQKLSAEVVIPSFFDRRNRLSVLNEVIHSDTDIEYFQYGSTASLERRASSRDYFEYGLGYQQIDERRENQWQTFRQVRVPTAYQYDSVRDPFNPNTGWRWSVNVEPVFDIQDDFSVFFKTGVGTQLFYAPDAQATLATRLSWDAIWTGGALTSTLDNVPESELYNAGGSTSVRGYAYQTIVSARGDEDSTLAGGTQRGLMVNELRLRLNDAWGLVGFWDRAIVSTEASALWQQNWFNSLGLGARYFTSFAPLRLDVAFPLNRRDSDDAFLIYFSLGQAF